MRRALTLVVFALILTSGAFAGTQFINQAGGANLSIGNNNEIFIDNTNDRVGIGTTSPTSGKLHIDSGSANMPAVFLTSSGSGWGSGIQFANTAGSGKNYGIYSGSTGQWSFADNAAGVDRIQVSATGNLSLQPSNGWVSVGSTAAGNGRLTVRGTGTGSGTYSFEAANSAGNSRFVVRDDGMAAFYGSDLAEKVRITETGAVGIGTTTPGNRLVVADGGTPYAGRPAFELVQIFRNSNDASQLSFGTTDNIFLVRFNTTGSRDALEFVDGGLVTRMSILNGGNVGIGTDSPGTLLTVRSGSAGNVIAVRNTGDSANTFLVTDTGAVTAASFSGAGTGLTGTASGLSIGGNAATATALATNPSNCGAGQYPLGIDASGNVEGCATAGVGTITGVTAGSGLTGGGTSGSVTLNVGSSTTITVNADDIAVAADSIGNTQLAFDTGQALTTASSPTFNGLTLSGDARIYRSSSTTTGYTYWSQSGDVWFGYDGTNFVMQGTPDPALNIENGLLIGGTSVITSSRNLVNIGTISTSGLITGGNGLTISTGTVSLPSDQIDSSEVSFNYAASGSKGGAASDVSCTNCVTLGTETSGAYDTTADTIADDGSISLTSEVSGTLPVANGGTGATTASGARSALGVPATDGTGASGTWSIDISGNAASASNANLLDSIDSTSFVRSDTAATFYRLTPYGVNGNSGVSPTYYGIYQESGAWTDPYPDMRIQFHTGIKYDAYFGYDGHRFYTGYDGTNNPAGLAFQIGVNGDNSVRSYNNFYAPIMYDQNDAAYYVDPASTSILNDIRPSIIYDRDDTSYYINPASTSVVNRILTAGRASDWSATGEIQANYLVANTGIYSYGGICTGTPSGDCNSNGQVWGTSDFRGTLFYDYDNTGFYVDPASTSILNDIRPSIIYDRDNTGFYVDPASTSRLSAVRSDTYQDSGGTARTAYSSGNVIVTIG